MKTALATKLLERFAAWPLAAAWGCMGGVAGRQAMAAGAAIAGGRPVRRAR